MEENKFRNIEIMSRILRSFMCGMLYSFLEAWSKITKMKIEVIAAIN
jgi:hypothetical protein